MHDRVGRAPAPARRRRHGRVRADGPVVVGSAVLAVPVVTVRVPAEPVHHPGSSLGSAAPLGVPSQARRR
ncbi:hypothetical protein JD79_00361 [Geodermatophilus normandii]|uniref:Uncharacterized protein n=1 Tax=Geodermatophilus normandii TaxID=1137989 RepID=A0A317QE22_9ACTN|nr:hypothetical protein JD79_00361 [Geodermatophilus normandii]